MRRNKPGAPVMMVYRSSRAPLSCRPCREKKRRCDRNDPCSSCSQRSIQCEYEDRGWPQELPTRSSSQHSRGAGVGAGQSGTTPPGARPTAFPDQASVNSTELIDRIRRLEEAVFTKSHNNTPSSNAERDALSGTTPNGTPFSCHSSHPSPDKTTQHATHITQLISHLPPSEQARDLFEHFSTAFNTNFGIVHMPSARSLMERIYQSLPGSPREEEPNIADLLLLFSIFAGAALCWTAELLEKMGSSRENAKSAFNTYSNLAISIVDSPRRPVPPSTTALVAIATLAQVIINSDDAFPVRALSLRTRCLLMAREMQLHRLDTARSREERRLKGANMIEVEIQRRIWWNMVATDWLGAFSGSAQEGVYNFHPRHMNVRYPCNVDDDFMKPSEPIPNLPLSTPTTMSHFLQRLKLADLCREIVDTVPPIINDFPEPDYEVILNFDRKLQDTLTQLPDFYKLDPASIQRSQQICKDRPYVEWHRLNVHFSLHARLCRLHRPYHLEGWFNPRYNYSRTACIRSAHKVLELRRMMDEVSVTSIFRPERFWVIMQHLSLAALTLAADVSFNPDAPDAEVRKEKVMAAYRTLEKSKVESNGLIAGIQRNIRAHLSNLQHHRSQTSGINFNDPSGPTQPAEQVAALETISNTQSSVDPGDTIMSGSHSAAGGKGENSQQLWTDFLAAVPDLESFQWTSLLDDIDLSPDFEFETC